MNLRAFAILTLRNSGGHFPGFAAERHVHAPKNLGVAAALLNPLDVDRR